MMNTQAGLGAALGAPQKQGQDLSGMMAMMAMLKNVPDQTLADVLAGKPITLDVNGSPTQVPQFAAMLAAQGRQELRTAMAGQQGQQPSIKDQLLSAEQQAANPQQMIVPPQQGMSPPQQTAQSAPDAQAGLDQLPAPNMKAMRAGGITGEEDVPRYNGTFDPALVKDSFMLDPNAPVDPNSFLNRKIAEAEEQRKKQSQREKEAQDTKDKVRNLFSPSTTNPRSTAYYNQPTRNNKGWGDEETADPSKALAPNTYAPPLVTQPSTASAGLDAALKNKQSVTPVAPVAPVTDPNAKQPPGTVPPEIMREMENENISKSIQSSIADLKDKHNRFQSMLDDYAKAEPERKKEIEDTRSQGVGQYMMNMGAALLANPQFGKAIQEGNTAGLAALNLSRKEAKDLQKDYRDYTFNMQKAAEAADQGNDELAQKYQSLASQHQNNIGTVAVQSRLAAVHEAELPSKIGVNEAEASYKKALPGILAAKGDPYAKIDASHQNLALTQATKQLEDALKDPRMKRDLLTPDAQTEFLDRAYKNNLNRLKNSSGFNIDNDAIIAELAKRQK